MSSKAVALKYIPNLPAPFICAKGQRELADRIVDIAHRNDVPILADRPLADTLYSVEIARYIPENLYKIIAEILVAVRDM